MRGKLIELAKDLPKLTAKQMEALILVHPYLEGLTHRVAAKRIGISRDGLQCRLKGAYKRVPGLQADMKKKRTELSVQRSRIRRPRRFGDMNMIGSDGTHDTYHGIRILRKF